jgi:hypothetical protein
MSLKARQLNYPNGFSDSTRLAQRTATRILPGESVSDTRDILIVLAMSAFRNESCMASVARHSCPG